MPELPEVETIKETLKQLVISETIADIDIRWDNIIKRPEDLPSFKKKLLGQTFRDVKRRGKFLLFELDTFVLVSHLRMEGKYYVKPSTEPVDKHTHVIFHLKSGHDLRYHDVRKFGTMHVFHRGKESAEKPLNQLGPDPFEPGYSKDYLYERLQRTSRTIKAALLDQTIIAGLGNIYVDETLFKAGIHPLTKANELEKEEVTKIHLYAKDVLQQAIQKGGTSIRSYVDGQGEMGMFQQELFVYGQEEEPCQKCGEMIRKIRVAGRGTHVCLTCQPLMKGV